MFKKIENYKYNSPAITILASYKIFLQVIISHLLFFWLLINCRRWSACPSEDRTFVGLNSVADDRCPIPPLQIQHHYQPCLTSWLCMLTNNMYLMFDFFLKGERSKDWRDSSWDMLSIKQCIIASFNTWELRTTKCPVGLSSQGVS